MGEASNGEQAVALARAHRPDVLLMNVRMPVVDGIEATRRITADPALSRVRVLVLTTRYAHIAGLIDADPAVYADCPVPGSVEAPN